MSGMNLDANALRPMVSAGINGWQRLDVPVADEMFEVRIRRRPVPASHTDPAEEPRAATLAEVAEVTGKLFRTLVHGSNPQEAGR